MLIRNIEHNKVLAAIENYNTFLDVGSGPGNCAEYLLNRNKDVELLDITTKYKIKMKRYFIEHKLKFIFHHSDILKFRTKKKYDIVYACEVIEHIRDWKAAIKKMLNLATCGVVLTTPVKDGFYDPDHKHEFKGSDFDWLKKRYKDKFFIYKTITVKLNLTNPRKRCFIIEIYK